MEPNVEATSADAGDSGSVDDAAPPQAASGKSPVGMAVVLFLVTLLAGGASSFFFYESTYRALNAPEAAEAESEEEDVPYGEFYEIQGMIINPSGSAGKRYLMVNLGLETSDSKVLADIEAKEIVIKDAVLRSMSERSVQELAEIAFRDGIKAELIERINEILEEGPIDRLYFTQYVLQ